MTNQGMNSPSIPMIRQSIQRQRIKKVPTRVTLGPCYQPKGRSALNAHQLKHPFIPNQTRGTQGIPQGTSHQRNDMAIEEPLCCRLLFYQKEEWEVTTGARLQTHQHVDHPEQIPPSTNPPADRPLERMHPLHKI